MKILNQTWPSQSLHKPVHFSLAMPAGDAPAGGWPIVLLLHGRGRNHLAITDHADFGRWFHDKRFALLCPMGDDGWWIDSPVSPASRYQSMLIELLNYARGMAALSGDAARLGVMGWSMGGFGAARFAVDRPDWVAALATIIGLLDFPLAGDNTYQTPSILGDAGQWTAQNPMTRIACLRGKTVGIFSARQAWDHAMNVRFHKALDCAEVSHEFTEYDGEHHIRAVEHAMPLAFAFMDRVLNRV